VPALITDARLVDEMSARGTEMLAQQGAASGSARAGSANGVGVQGEDLGKQAI
jgi:hypothetical protein